MASTIGMPPPPVPTPAIRHSRPVSTGQTVTVACKLPSGVLLRCHQMEKIAEPQQGGGYRDIMRSRPIPDKQFAIRGPWSGSAGQAYNKGNPAVAELLPGGYALTHGVPKEIWDHWLSENKNTPLVRNRIIFAYPAVATVTEEAHKLRAVKTGLEPLDPDKPAERMPGGVDRRMRLGILTQDEGTSSR
jgi:hypothetical protein